MTFCSAYIYPRHRMRAIPALLHIQSNTSIDRWELASTTTAFYWCNWAVLGFWQRFPYSSSAYSTHIICKTLHFSLILIWCFPSTHFMSKSSCPTGSLLLSFLLARKPSGSHRTPCLCFLLAASIPRTRIRRIITTANPTRYGKTSLGGSTGVYPGGHKDKSKYQRFFLCVILVFTSKQSS